MRVQECLDFHAGIVSQEQKMGRHLLPRRIQCILLLSATIWATSIAHAQISGGDYEFCGYNPTLEPETRCFDSFQEAEDYVKQEPTPAVGRHLLEPVSGFPTIVSNRDLKVEYRVPPRPPESRAGETYHGFGVPSAAHVDCTAPSHPYLHPTDNSCLTEESVISRILERNGTNCYELFGTIIPQPIRWRSVEPYPDYLTWGDKGMIRGSIQLDAHYPPYPRSIVDFLCAASPGDGKSPSDWNGNYYWSLGPTAYYWCPAHFRGTTRVGGGSGDFSYDWPQACTNAQIGNVTTRLRGICQKGEGNPCIPATGAKVQEETDFTWGRLRYFRTYSSILQIVDNSLLGAGWTHRFGARIWTTNNSNLAYLQDASGNLEKFTRTSSTAAYASTDQVGKVLTHETIGLHRWILTESDGTQWFFNDTGGSGNNPEIVANRGLLKEIRYPHSPADNLTLTYCNNAEFLAGTCNVSYSLIAIADARGRILTFDYSDPTYNPDYRSPKLTSISDDEGILASYDYNSTGMLWKVTYRPNSTAPTTRMYLYGEGANVCKDADGSQLTPCPTSGFPKLLTGKIDEDGNRYLDVTYDNRGRATASSHPEGAERVSLIYSTSDTQVTMPDGSVKTYIYSDELFPRLTSLSVSGGGQINTTNRTYENPSRRLKDETDPRNLVTRHGYDTYHETSRIDALGTPEQRTIQTDWDPVISSISERRTYNANSVLEARQQWAYNPRGQAIAVCQIDPADPAAMSYTCSAAVAPPADAKVRRTVNTYCELSDVSAGICPLEGLLIQANGPRLPTDPGTNGLDDITTYIYRMQDDSSCATGGACTYRKGDLWKVTNALGQVTETVKYDKAGRPTRIKDANGTLTDMVYHPRGWLTDRIVRSNVSGFPSSNDATTHIDYYPTGDVMKVTQPDGAFLAYTYDAAHRLIRITDTLGNTIDYCPGGVGSADCLDAAGNRRVEQIKDPGGVIKRSLRRTYNQLGQLTATLNAASQATLSYPASDGYDPNGNPTHSEDGLGVETRQEYDPLNRLKTTIQDYLGSDPETANATTGYTYDARDNLRQVTDPDGLNTVYDYDGLNNLTGLHSPDTGDTTYTYDLAGNRVTQTDARNIQSTYSYDALNRLTAITYPTAAKNLSYTYDQPDSVTGCIGSYPLGRLTRMTDESGTTTYCYDRRGNVLRKVQVTALDTLALAYTWTLADRLSSITYPSGRIVSYARNGIGQITSVTMQQSAGAPPEVLISAASYYPFGPLNVLTFGNGRSLSKTYDGDYAIDSVASSDPNGLVLDFSTDVMGNITSASNTLGASTPTRQYDYDALYRLTEVKDASNAVLEHYAYSKTGDRTQRTLAGQAPQSYAYVPGTHRLASIDGQARSYDANGNTTLNPDALSSAFIYDDRNRLSQIPGISSAQYRYNARGERVGKLHTMGYLGGNERISAYDEQGKLMSYVDYRINNLGKRTLAGSHDLVYLDDLPVALLGKGATRYLETDHLGTPRLASNAKTGTTNWQWDFLGDGFGANDASVIDADADLPLRYPGQQYDAESGLHYNYFRDYEPGTGRYVESDPIGLVGGAATFLYANGSPAIFADLKGGIPEPGFLIPPNYRNSTIVCDGRGGIEPYIPLSPFDMECIGDCIRLHELIHVRDFKAANPWVCRGQKQFTRINEFDDAELWRSERNAYTESLRCLRRKLESEMSNPCPTCRIRLESEIEKHEKELDRYTR